MFLRKRPSDRKMGDLYRDAKRWKEAEAAYARHLARHGDDVAIWVQYGHALNEGGNFGKAEDAYRKATELRPDDVDAGFHLRLLLQRQGKATAADQAVPASRVDTEEAEPLTDGTILFAIQDLLIFLSHYVTMSGIQRVQCGIADHIIDMSDVESRFIITDQSGVLKEGTYWEIDKQRLREIIHYASGNVVDHYVLKRMIQASEKSARTVTPGHGQMIVLLGCFWAHDNTVDRFLPAKRNGAVFGSYLYDIIPISHPEFCEGGLVKMFSQGLSEMCVIADFFLTISDYTRVTLESFLDAHGSRRVPMMTVPLAHSLTGSEKASSEWPEELSEVRDQEFVAYVSTLEGRKNHIYVLNVWSGLIAKGMQVPHLVFVGRRGWRVDGLFDYLEETNHLNGRVHIVHDLSDGQLNAVYEHSLFTVFTSLVEGWGLPVGESLLHGKVCVASSTTSIPEVGAGFTDYIDPTDVQNGIEVIGRLIADRKHLANRRKNIEDNFQPRGWGEVARMFVERTRELSGCAQEKVDPRPLSSGSVFRPGDISRPPQSAGYYSPAADRLILNGSFYSPEPWGAWMKGREGEIVFQTDLHPGDEIIVYLDVREAHWERSGEFTIEIAEAGYTGDQVALPVTLGMATHHQLQLRGCVGSQGECRILIKVLGHYQNAPEDGRDFVLGLSALGYAALEDAVSRSRVMESVIFSPASERRWKTPASLGQLYA